MLKSESRLSLDGSDTHNFNGNEQLVIGATGGAGIAAEKQSHFLQLYLKGDAFKHFLTPPEDIILVFELIVHALRTRFTKDD